MKHKTNVGPGLIVALGSGSGGVSDAGDRATGQDSGTGAPPYRRGDTNALSDAADMDTVPLSMLSMPDDQEQMQPPEVGDVVNYQVTGKVVAIEGGNAKVQRQSINGQELPGCEDPSSQGSDAASATGDDGGSDTGNDEGQSLRNDAAGIGMLS